MQGTTRLDRDVIDPCTADCVATPWHEAARYRQNTCSEDKVFLNTERARRQRPIDVLLDPESRQEATALIRPKKRLATTSG